MKTLEMKTLEKKTLLNRREFLRKQAGRSLAPLVAVYLIGKMTPPLFGQTSGGGGSRPEPI